MLKTRTSLSLIFISVFSLFCLFTGGRAAAQSGTLRGHLYDQVTGAAISFANIVLEGTEIRTVSDLDGFFNFPD
ncbi:MAG: hypothetical protein ABJB16_15245, partial [Saprospiraceae bacterium]